MNKQIYRATVFYTDKRVKNPMGGSMFAWGTSKEEVEVKFRNTLNEQLVANGFERDMFRLDIIAVSIEEVEAYFENKKKGSGGAVN